MRVHHNPGAASSVTAESTVPKNTTDIQSADTNAPSQQAKKKTAKKNEATEPTVQMNVIETDDSITISFGSPAVYVKEEYKTFADDLSHISIDNFYEKQSKRIIKEAIAEIVAVEGPISQPALIRSLINTTSLGRASKQITEHLDMLVAAADVKITRQAGVRFLWNHGTEPTEYLTYRVKEQRNPEDVCKYELKNAVCYLIQENGPMTKEEITKAMIAMFGYSRSSQKIVDGAAAAIKAARELKAIEQNDKKQYVLV